MEFSALLAYGLWMCMAAEMNDYTVIEGIEYEEEAAYGSINDGTNTRLPRKITSNWQIKMKGSHLNNT